MHPARDPRFHPLSPAWRDVARPWLGGTNCESLCRFLDARTGAGATIYPPEPLAALARSGPREVRVVILGQDPYHGPGQAHGFAFSVPAGMKVPPSLRNIRREVERDTGAAPPPSDLRGWAGQGVLLLNTVLTVEEGEPASHAGQGWEGFTDTLIDALARSPEPRAFLLWGAHAQAKRARIEAAGTRHLILCANHPSPLSASRPPIPFLGCGHFSKTNQFLQERGATPIDWTK
jgi:uracil-DNA glycosylase